MFLRGIELFGRHGVFDQERRDGQIFVVDVEWLIDTLRAAATDRLDATVCYQQIYDCVVEIVGGPPQALIETLANRLADVLLARFVAIDSVTVTLHKPQAPLGGKFLDVGIVVRQGRPESNKPSVNYGQTAPSGKPAA